VPDPLRQLQDWIDDARERGEGLPTAMTLATVSADGEPSARTVALKEIDERGLVFTTTLQSRKAAELQAEPRVALVFWWPAVQRQVRVSGRAELLGADEAERLFADRPRAHQLQTHVSRQGAEIDGLERLRSELAELERRFDGRDVPRPDDFGGVRVVPEVVEFWEEGEARLHDRVEYARGDSGWDARRLAP
jgi:pyridoxamine 5'-phosphate oxidase